MTKGSLSSIIRSRRELKKPIRVHGATATSRQWATLGWARESQSKVIYILPTLEKMNEAYDNILTLNQIQASEHPAQVDLFPTWEQSPYGSIALSAQPRLERLKTLANIHGQRGPSQPQVVVTTLPALCQTTLHPEAFQESTLELKVDESVRSREALVQKLENAGYQRVDPVEDPGTYSFRGDIVDVFPVQMAEPIRIELFGDTVEKIRHFDAETQRTHKEEKSTASIAPAREVLINDSTASALRSKIKVFADDLGIPRPLRDPILSSISPGSYPERSDTWASFVDENPITLLNHLDSNWEFIWDDELTSQQYWDQFSEAQSSLAEEAKSSGMIVPPFRSLYLWSTDLEKKVLEKSSLHFERLEFATDDGKIDIDDETGEENSSLVTERHRVQTRGNSDLFISPKEGFQPVEEKIKLWIDKSYEIFLFVSTESQVERFRRLLEDKEISLDKVKIRIGSLSEGFRWPANRVAFLTEHELLRKPGRSSARNRAVRKRSGGAKSWQGLQVLSDLAVDDLVVHVDHGIGRYKGLKRLEVLGAASDFLLIEYAKQDKVYLPVYHLNLIQKYMGGHATTPLDRLGQGGFAKRKSKVKEAVRKLAIDLIELYAEREIQEGIRFGARDSTYQEFEAKFPFEETVDQAKAIDTVLDDLHGGKVMDRLVCGDVGYGKTEVAIRAAFRAVLDGYQVAVLVPTTVLAHQHELSFRQRLKDYPCEIESLSRFKGRKEQKEILERVKEGKVDIVIGTHRLLSKDVEFKNLALLIVDEEHRFGVEHKERLKTLRVDTHVLTLTATPIPRTLHFALSGLRDISLITTAPVDRRPIRTYVSRYDEPLIKRAIEFELNRGGQVFFIHNRVQSIYEMATRIEELVPHANVIVGHGKMTERQLEKVMVDFYEKKANVLVCTTIIESGIDLPTANTMLVNRADTFGLSQLYQIRGRVGRSHQRAYAYLLIPNTTITEEAKQRLEILQRFADLGSGFSIASHDLELRGGGDLLGANQSGHIAAVGFDLYTELLNEAVEELRGKQKQEAVAAKPKDPEIKAAFPSFISEEYIPNVNQRLTFYRRLASSSSEDELHGLEEELQDRFGPLPTEAQNLVWMIRIKLVLKDLGIEVLTVGAGKVSLQPGKNSRLEPARAIALVSSHPKQYQLTPDSKIVAKISTQSLSDLYFGLSQLIEKLT